MVQKTCARGDKAASIKGPAVSRLGSGGKNGAHSAEAAAVTGAASHSARHRAHGRTRAGGNRVVGAEHADARAELGSAEGHHVLANVSGNQLAVLRGSVCEDILDEIVAVLVTGNINERDPGPIEAAFADAVQVAAQKIWSANFQALLNHLRSKLVHAVLGGVADDVVNGTATVCRRTMLTHVLDTPVAKLAVGNDVNVGEYLLNTRTLGPMSVFARSR